MLTGMGRLNAEQKTAWAKSLARQEGGPVGIFGQSNFPVTPGIGFFPQGGIVKPMVKGKVVDQVHRGVQDHLISQGVNKLSAESTGKKVFNWADDYLGRFVEEKAKKRGHGFTKALCKKAKLKRRK